MSFKASKSFMARPILGAVCSKVSKANFIDVKSADSLTLSASSV